MKGIIHLEIQDTQIVYRGLTQKGPLLLAQRLSLPVGVIRDGKIIDLERLKHMLKGFLPKSAKQCYLTVDMASVVTFTHHIQVKNKKDLKERLIYYGEQFSDYGNTYAMGYWTTKEKDNTYKVQGLGIPKEWFEAYHTLSEYLRLDLKSILPRRAYLLKSIEKHQLKQPTYSMFIENNKLYGVVIREGQQISSLVLCETTEIDEIRNAQSFGMQLERSIGWYEKAYPQEPLVHCMIALPKNKMPLYMMLSEISKDLGLMVHEEDSLSWRDEKWLKTYTLLPYTYQYNQKQLKKAYRCLSVLAGLTIVGVLGGFRVTKEKNFLEKQLAYRESEKKQVAREASQVEVLDEMRINTLYQHIYPKLKPYESTIESYHLDGEKNTLTLNILMSDLNKASKMLKILEEDDAIYITCHLEDWVGQENIRLKLEVKPTND